MDIQHIIYKVQIIAACCVAVCSCRFLEVEHLGKSDIDSFYNEPAAVKAAVYGTHKLAFDVFDKYILLYAEVAGDCLVLDASQASWVLMQDFTITPDDEISAMGYIWKSGFQVINNTNQIIEHIPALKEQFPNNAAELDNYCAMAYFLRGFMHFEMCQCFAQTYTYTSDASHPGIPIVTRALSLSEKIGRSSVAQVYAQVEKDINMALSLFNASLTPSRYLPGPDACNALLARVCLYKGQWSEAEKYATRVIDAVPLSPASSYADMFCAMREPAVNEIIYSLNGQRHGQGTSYAMYYHIEPKARPSSRVTDLIEEGDIRESVVSADGDAACMKFNIPDQSDKDAYSNIPLLRASEMYLIRAEALNNLKETAKAAEDIEKLQSRAMGSEITLPEMTQEEMDELIEAERIRELCFEGHRLWDIARRHKNIERPADHKSTVKSLTYPNNLFILPIPSVEMEANDAMTQNEGYSSSKEKPVGPVEG